MVSALKISTGKVFIILFIGLITITSYFILSSHFSYIEKNKIENLAKLRAVANAASMSISPEELKQLMLDYPSKNDISTSESSELYLKYHKILKRCLEINNYSSPVYTIHKNEHTGTFEYGITSSDKPYFRHQYADPPEILHSFYYTGGEIENYKTARGSWLSVICPITTEDGEVVAAIEMDLPYDTFLAEARKVLIKNSLISSLVYLVIGVMMFKFISKVLKEEQKEKEIVAERKFESDYKQREISSSISYARKIQKALWPDNEKLRMRFNDFFSINLPKDTVSGDFYWHHEFVGSGDYLVIHADCTGHGVPGAMMSVLGNTILNEIVVNYGISAPDQILNLANKKLITLLQQEKEDNLDDGMAVSVALLNKESMTLKYAGANQNGIIIRNGQLIDLEGDKYPVGGAHYNPERLYSLKTVLLEENDSLYLFSDGFKDQFGGPQNKKFLSSNFYKMLVEHSRKSMDDQKEVILDIFRKWRGGYEQIDDVSIVGLKI